jgi:hypothetical protein
MPTLSGTVRDLGDGFIVLSAGARILVSSRVWPADLAAGARVIVKARQQDDQWIAEDVEVLA